jgi:enoyl-CoA hydratase/carnithine racemase
MLATGAKRARIIYVFKGEKSLRTSIIEHVVERDDKLIEEIKARLQACVDAVSRIERVRDNEIEKACIEVDGAGVPDFADLKPELKSEIRGKMVAAAEEYGRLTECQMKSKGKPKYCDGRDFCFGVRKRKKKKAEPEIGTASGA